jgi:hypothetical protein
MPRPCACGRGPKEVRQGRCRKCRGERERAKARGEWVPPLKRGRPATRGKPLPPLPATVLANLRSVAREWGILIEDD